MYQLLFTREAQRDSKKIAKSHLKNQVLSLLEILKADPFQTPPTFKKLLGDYAGAYSRRINLHHRLVYTVDMAHKTVKILSMWDHYK